MSEAVIRFRLLFGTYFDDILIFRTLWEEHLQHLETVFNCLKAASLKIKLSKYLFFKINLYYLRHLISKQGIQLLPQDKTITMKNLSEPKNIDELNATFSD